MTDTPTPEELFWDKVELIPFHSCWIWMGSLRGKGYGGFKWKGKMANAHRVAWELSNGPIPSGEGRHGTCVLHTCDNRLCVRPGHLFLGGNRDNAHDRDRKGRGDIATAQRVAAELNRAKQFCKRGHPLSDENVAIEARGRRRCKACRRIVWHKNKHNRTRG